MYRIYIAEDDRIIAEQVAKKLNSWGYDTRITADFLKIMEEFSEYDPQLVLMDIKLPFYSGYHWCSQIRTVSKVPIVFMSSASDNMNIVMAMNMGGDDFISKPFDSDVLVAKVQAMLRRTYDFTGEITVFEHNGLILNIGQTEVEYDGRKAELTKNEFRILKILMENKGRTVARDDLMRALWESDCFIDDNTLTVNVNRLRRKLDELGAENYIKTKKGMGYMI